MDKRKKVAFHTLGCKLNFSETSTIANTFKNEGFDRVSFSDKADIYVINTCSVTQNADKEFKTHVKKALQGNKNAFVIAIGCYAQLKSEEVAKIEGVHLVLGAKEKFNVTHYINSLSKQETTQIHCCEIENVNTYVSSYSIGDRTRSFLKIQDGCDYKCTYCTIPLARGISRSDTLENIIANAKEITQNGIKEIVLTGVNVGDYGKGEFGNKPHDHTFLDVIDALEKQVNIERLRISSIEPNLLTDDIIEQISHSNKFVPHFHVPLQSGSDKILKLMRRRYLTNMYQNKVATIQHEIPNCCIGVDVIVGFPGETDDDFLKTYNFLANLDISYLHVFSYSERDDTVAQSLKEKVPVSVKKERSKMLRGLSAKKYRLFVEKHIGTKRSVLFESDNKNGFIEGYTDNYIRVKRPFDTTLINRIQPMELSAIATDGVVI